MIDLDRAAAASNTDRSPFGSLLALIESGDEALQAVHDLRDTALGSDAPGVCVDVSALTLQAPFPGRRFALAGSNNADHVADAYRNRGQDLTAAQVRDKTRQGKAGGFWVIDPPVGPGSDIPTPGSADGLLDYEAEVAIVLGRGGKRIKSDDWLDHVWGTTLVIDWSLRADDLALIHQPFYAHKIFDASKSVGPWIDVGGVDPMNCQVQTRVNGDLRQDFNSGAGMIHDYGELLAQMSADLTLAPGDLLAGGTGPGTALDSTVVHGPGRISRDRFLKPGDTVSVSAENLGTLTGNVVAS